MTIPRNPTLPGEKASVKATRGQESRVRAQGRTSAESVLVAICCAPSNQQNRDGGVAINRTA